MKTMNLSVNKLDIATIKSQKNGIVLQNSEKKTVNQNSILSLNTNSGR